MSSSPIPPTSPGTSKPAQIPGQVVQIQSLPDALQNVARATRIEGEVVGQNSDGSTRIKTSEGNIDVTIRGRQPQEGQRIEIDIPAGNPPRQATIRAAPAQQQPVPPQNSSTPPPTQQAPLPQTPVTSPPANTPPPATGTTPTPTPVAQPSSGAVTTAPAQPLPPVSTTAPVTKPPAPSLPSSYQPPPQGVPAPPPPGTPLPPLNAGQIVRLISLPPAQAQTFIQQAVVAPDSILASQITKTSFQADLIARGGQDTLKQTLFQVIKSLNAVPVAQQAKILSAPPLQSGPIPAKSDATGLIPPSAGAYANVLQEIPVGSTQSFPVVPLPEDSLDGFIHDNLSAPKLFQLDVKILDIKPPLTQLVPAPSETPGKTPMDALLKPQVLTASANDIKPTMINAVVTGFTTSHLPLVTIQWPTGALSQNLILQFAAGNVETGSHILLQPQTAYSGASLLPGTTLPRFPAIPLLNPASLWPAMDDLYQTLSQSAPQLAQALGRAMPSPANGGQFGPAAMLFIAAARAGSLDTWLGEKKIEALGKIGKDSLISRLTQDATSIARASADAPDGEWRSYPIPLLWQNDISRVLFHVKHEEHGGDKDQKESSTRFLFDLDLPRMGDVQLDGMLRGQRLDLIVRTQLPISNSMQDAMKIAYASALDGTDIFGELAFQGDLKHWMQVVSREKALGVTA